MGTQWVSYYAQIRDQHGKFKQYITEPTYMRTHGWAPNDCCMMIPGSIAQMQTDMMHDDRFMNARRHLTNNPSLYATYY